MSVLTGLPANLGTCPGVVMGVIHQADSVLHHLNRQKPPQVTARSQQSPMTASLMLIMLSSSSHGAHSAPPPHSYGVWLRGQPAVILDAFQYWIMATQWIVTLSKEC